MNSSEIGKKMENFVCRRCNECCKQPGYVYLAEGEPETIARYLKLETYDFTDRYSDVIARRRLVLKKHADESCVFLKDDGCSIHSVKPVQCREFPSRWQTERSFQYCQGLKELFTTSPLKS